MRIFIYHPNMERKKRLEGYINAYYKKVRREKTLVTFSQIDVALSWLESNGKQIDILFIDGTNPKHVMSLAGKLRECNQEASWVYIEGTTEEVLDSLLLRPSAYIKDLTNAKQIVKTIHQLDCYCRQFQRKHSFSFKFEGEYISIPFGDIAYFESCAKKVMLHLVDQSRIYNFTAKLDEIQTKMPETFLRCHQSYLVNMDAICSLDTNEHLFVLKNNKEVLISRRQYITAKEQYENYKGEKSIW